MGISTWVYYFPLFPRLVSMVVTLRDWAHKSLQEEEERPDSFLERFRGPELQVAPSRISINRSDAHDGNNSAKTKWVCPVTPLLPMKFPLSFLTNMQPHKIMKCLWLSEKSLMFSYWHLLMTCTTAGCLLLPQLYCTTGALWWLGKTKKMLIDLHTNHFIWSSKLIYKKSIACLI